MLTPVYISITLTERCGFQQCSTSIYVATCVDKSYPTVDGPLLRYIDCLLTFHLLVLLSIIKYSKLYDTK